MEPLFNKNHRPIADNRCMNPNRQNSRLRIELLESREVPAGIPLVAFGADSGAEPRLRILERQTGQVKFDFLAFNAGFKGGVRVAIGDVNGDGQDDVIAATGPGVTPIVKVFDGSSGNLIKRFAANIPRVPNAENSWYASQMRGGSVASAPFLGGIFVASADLNGDGKAEIITGCGAGSIPLVSVFNGMTGQQLRSFVCGSPSTTSGIRVATGDLDGDGMAEIIVAASTGQGARVRAIDGRSFRTEINFLAATPPTKGGLYVAAADLDGDGLAEILVSSNESNTVNVHDGRTGLRRTTFNSGVSGTGGIRVAGALISEDGKADVLVGSTDNEAWTGHDGTGLQLSTATLAGFNTGMWVACSSEQAEINRHASQTIVDWNTAALNAIRAEKTNPPKASRALAIVQASVFDAVNGISRPYRRYLAAPFASPRASVQAAASQAAYTALVALFPTQVTQFDTLLTASLAKVADSQSKTDGIAWGWTVANVILASRAADGSTATVAYSPGTNPADWQPTLPAMATAMLPGWGDVRPFAMGKVGNFLPVGPPDLTSQEWADEFNEIKSLGSKTGSTRTADQTEIALFWADGGGTFTPPGHWNAIAGQLALADGLSLLQTARLFAQLNMAEADAAIASWKAKFTYNFWRPITAIRNADTDGNALTQADAAWEPLLATPPFPDYTSGHSTFSGAASAILAGHFGTDRSFSTQSDNGLLTRTFANFGAAADEAGKSRIYGGIHYQGANEDGLATGRAIAKLVLSRLLKSR